MMLSSTFNLVRAQYSVDIMSDRHPPVSGIVPGYRAPKWRHSGVSSAVWLSVLHHDWKPDNLCKLLYWDSWGTEFYLWFKLPWCCFTMRLQGTTDMLTCISHAPLHTVSVLSLHSCTCVILMKEQLFFSKQFCKSFWRIKFIYNALLSLSTVVQ